MRTKQIVLFALYLIISSFPSFEFHLLVCIGKLSDSQARLSYIFMQEQ